jgi:hypothetical protein
MADLFVGCNVGGKKVSDLTIGTSTGSTDIELRVKKTATPLATKIAVLEAIEAIEGFFQSPDAPPNTGYTP